MNFFVILLFLLASGVFIVLHRIPLSEIGKDFYRFVTLHYLVGMTMVLVTIQPEQSHDWIQFGIILLAVLTGILHYFLLLGSRELLRSGAYWLSTMLSIIGLLSLAYLSPLPENTQSFVPPFLTALHLIASAAVLGAILDGMMCGHWYLVNPDLNLIPIRSISRALTLAILLKIILVGWSLLLAESHNPDLYRGIALSFRQHGFLIPILFWVRILVGLSGGLFFNWMSWKAIEHGNTQAATGILYACIVWIILGEFSGLFLTIQAGVPL